MRILLAAIICSLSFVGRAEPIKITGSESPDGKLFITIEPSPVDEGIAAGTAQIRVKETNQIVGTFDWSGFGVRATADAFKVLWKPDNKAFAISWELDRGYMSYAIYAKGDQGWKNIKTPDYLTEIFKENGFSSGYGKGHETPVAWQANNILVLDVGGKARKQSDLNDQATGEYAAAVSLALKMDRGSLVLVLVNIKKE